MKLLSSRIFRIRRRLVTGETISIWILIADELIAQLTKCAEPSAWSDKNDKNWVDMDGLDSRRKRRKRSLSRAHRWGRTALCSLSRMTLTMAFRLWFWPVSLRQTRRIPRFSLVSDRFSGFPWCLQPGNRKSTFSLWDPRTFDCLWALTSMSSRKSWRYIFGEVDKIWWIWNPLIWIGWLTEKETWELHRKIKLPATDKRWYHSYQLKRANSTQKAELILKSCRIHVFSIRSTQTSRTTDSTSDDRTWRS